MNRNISNIQARSDLQGQIHGLLQSLRQLAPHPAQKNVMAPLFLSFRADFQPVSEHDSMLGAVAMENFLGASFFEASHDVSSAPAFYMDFDTMGDLASEYISETASENKGRGKGTIALGEHKVVANDFNMNSHSPAMMAFLKDLPERRRIEEHIAALVRTLDSPEAPALHGPALAAA